MYGQEARLPIDVAIGQDTNGNQNTDEILVTQEKQKQRYDKTHRYVEYEVG